MGRWTVERVGAMAVTPKYTQQLVVTEEPEIDQRVRALERMGPVTLAAAHRVVLRLGLAAAEERFAAGDFSEPEIPARVLPESAVLAPRARRGGRVAAAKAAKVAKPAGSRRRTEHAAGAA